VVTTQDASVGFSQETTYGTYVAPTRWLEYTDESLDFNKNIKQGQGLRVGGRVARSARRVVPTADAGGDVSYELTSKGMGLLFDSALGSSTSTLVSGTTFQQVFTLGDTPKSLTVQKGLPEAGGTVDAYTFLGAMIAQLELTFANADIGMAKFTLDCKDLSTAQSYVAPSYPTTPSLYHFANWSIQTGTLTAPTTTALASMPTPIADFRDATVQINNNLRNDRFNGGGSGRKSKPTVGLRTITGSATVEYDSTTFRDAVLNETPMGLLLQYTGAALSTGVETIQVVLPEVKFDSELPKTNGTDLITQPMQFAVLDNLTAAQPIWIVIRTSDAAI
jgi:hypothetical protein